LKALCPTLHRSFARQAEEMREQFEARVAALSLEYRTSLQGFHTQQLHAEHKLQQWQQQQEQDQQQQQQQQLQQQQERHEQVQQRYLLKVCLEGIGIIKHV